LVSSLGLSMSAVCDVQCTQVHCGPKRPARAAHPFCVRLSGRASVATPSRRRAAAGEQPWQCPRRSSGRLRSAAILEPPRLRRGPWAACLAAGFAAAAALALAGLEIYRLSSSLHSPTVPEHHLQGASAAVQVGAADVPLPAFHFEAFRRLVGDEFEVRRGPGPNDVKFRPRLAMTTVPWPYRSWTRAQLIGSAAKPRLGRQSFAAPNDCHKAGSGPVVPYAGQVLIMAAFEKQYNSGDVGVGRWWLKDSIACSRRGNAFHLALREAEPAGELAVRLRQRLRRAAAEEARYPKVA